MRMEMFRDQRDGGDVLSYVAYLGNDTKKMHNAQYETTSPPCFGTTFCRGSYRFIRLWKGRTRCVTTGGCAASLLVIPYVSDPMIHRRLCACLRSTALTRHKAQCLQACGRWRSGDLSKIGPVEVLDVIADIVEVVEMYLLFVDDQLK